MQKRPAPETVQHKEEAKNSKVPYQILLQVEKEICPRGGYGSMKEQELREALKKLEPVIGKKTVKALWLRHLMIKDKERKQKSEQKIMLMAEKGYEKISDESLMKATKGWNFNLGPLAFFGTNHLTDTFNIRLIAS